MPLSKAQAQAIQYIGTVVLIVAGLCGIKLLIVWGSENFLHTIPILGGWLKSLEIVELSNIIIFALLGFGLGAATRYLPKQSPFWQKSMAFIVAMPIVFLSSYWFQQILWISEIAETSEVPYKQAATAVNQMLEQEVSMGGFWGYFRYTTEMPILPTSVEGLQNIADDQQWFRSEMSRFSGLGPGLFTIIFNSAGWGIRLFLVLLSFLTGIIYFFKGITWADAVHLRRLAIGKR